MTEQFTRTKERAEALAFAVAKLEFLIDAARELAARCERNGLHLDSYAAHVEGLAHEASEAVNGFAHSLRTEGE